MVALRSEGTEALHGEGTEALHAEGTEALHGVLGPTAGTQSLGPLLEAAPLSPVAPSMFHQAIPAHRAPLPDRPDKSRTEVQQIVEQVEMKSARSLWTKSMPLTKRRESFSIVLHCIREEPRGQRLKADKIH